MSTRAVYSITNTNGATTHVYIHHDGYMTGAADYFWKGLLAYHGGPVANREPRASQAAYDVSFLRANLRAEITTSPDHHGDLAYKYSLNETTGKLIVETRAWSSENPEWAIAWTGNLWDFINQHADMIDGWEPVHPTPGSTLGMTYTEIKHRREKVKAELLDYTKKFPHYTGNIRALEDDVARWDRCVANFETIAPAIREIKLSKEQARKAEQDARKNEQARRSRAGR